MSHSRSPQVPVGSDRIQLHRRYTTDHQEALGPGWLSFPAYYHDYIGVLGPGQWWAGAVLWSRVPQDNAWTELPLREWAALSATSPSRLAAALRPGTPLSWLIERDPTRPAGAQAPDTKTRLPARYRWRCGLPLTPGHQQDVLRWFAEHLRTYGRRPTLATLVRALEDLAQLPAQEVRGCLGPAARPAPGDVRPLTLREILQVASGLTLPVSVELAQLSQRLYTQLAPQDWISIPEALPADWLSTIGHGALWLYVYAYTQSLLGDTPGVCSFEQGLSGLAALVGSGRTTVRRWIEQGVQLDLLSRPEALPTSEVFRLRVTAPTAMPLGAARAAALEARGGRVSQDPRRPPSPLGAQAESISSTSVVHPGYRPSPSGDHRSLSDTPLVQIEHKPPPWRAQARSIGSTGDLARKAADSLALSWDESKRGAEEEERESIYRRTPETWMPLPELALRAGVSSPSQQQLQQAATRLPQEYVAFFLENLAADLPAVIAWRNGILSAPRVAAGVREPYRGLVAAGPTVVALALQGVLTPDQGAVVHALGEHVENAQDLADELGAKIPDRAKRERACRLALRALSTAEGRSLRDHVDGALANAQRVWARQQADVIDEKIVTDTQEETDPKEVLWGRALAQLQMEIPRATFDMWLKDTQLIEISGNAFVVRAASDFGAQWLTHRMGGALRRILSGLVKNDSIEVTVRSVPRVL